MPRDVFISYARKDIDRIRLLVDALAASDLEIWWDTKLEAGDSWRRVLLQRLSTADGLVVCWSEAAVKSEYVLAEARIALDRALLIPALIEPCEPPHPFGEIQTVDLVGWRGALDDPAFLRLKAAINRNAAERQANERFQVSLHKIAAVLARLDIAKVKADAADGNVVAQSILGHAHIVGTDALPRDLSVATSWLERAAGQGDLDAAATLGTIHSLLIDPANWREATRWFEHAAQRGHAGAALELAHIYETGFEGVDKNSELAAWYRGLAAQFGSAR